MDVIDVNFDNLWHLFLVFLLLALSMDFFYWKQTSNILQMTLPNEQAGTKTRKLKVDHKNSPVNRI